ncbi:MAG TPA: hypothetical protein VGB55_09885 [Tepidisphaeraceae bacterium]
MNRKPLIAAVLLLSAAFARAELPADASVDQVLDALHQRGQNLKSLAADVKLAQIDNMGDESTRTGTLVLQRAEDGDSKVRVTFNKTQRGKRITDARRDFVLDGQALIDRDWEQKKQTTRIVRQPGEKLDLFKLGEGPFPLPIGQPKEAVLKEFDVKKATVESPAAGMNHVELTPREGTPSARKFASLTVAVRPDGWPVEVTSSDANQTSTTIATLSNIRINDAVKASEFTLEPIGDDWRKIEEAYRE